MLLLLLLLSLRPLLLQLLLRFLLPGKATPFLDRPRWLLLWLLLVLQLQIRLLLRFLVCSRCGCFLRDYSGCCRVCWRCMPREKCRLTTRNLLKGLVR